MSRNQLLCCGQPADLSGFKIQKIFYPSFDIVTETKERLNAVI